MALPTLRPHPAFSAFTRTAARRIPYATQFHGTFYRAAAAKYAKSEDLISGAGSRLHGARWNPPDLFCAVYGSLIPATALAESLAVTRYYAVDSAGAFPLVIAACEAKLDCVLDLTDATALAEFGVTMKQIAAEDWRKLNAKREESLTQAIGRAATGEGVEGLLVPSLAVSGAKNIVVFPELLPAGRPLRARGISH